MCLGKSESVRYRVSLELIVWPLAGSVLWLLQCDWKKIMFATFFGRIMRWEVAVRGMGAPERMFANSFAVCADGVVSRAQKLAIDKMHACFW